MGHLSLSCAGLWLGAAVFLLVGCSSSSVNCSSYSLRDGNDTDPIMQERMRSEGMSELMIAVLDDASDEERKMFPVTKAKVNAFLANDDYTSSAKDFISTGFTSLSALIYMDYSQEPAALAKAIGDALVPIIALGLALIPGVGPIIAGIFTGLWALFSPLLGGEKESEESKMEKMINEAIKKAHKVTDQKLSNLLASSVRGELSRNQYVCDKYSVIAGNFSKNWVRIKSVNDTFRLEMIMFLDDCDNFLKDTSEAFVHPDYAYALWIPSAMTTLTRTAFLTDVINYAHILGIPQKFIENYFKEMKADVKRHFNLHALGMTQRMKTIEETKGLNGEEMTSCRMQKELLFLDRSLYPYGIPKRFVNHDNGFALTANDFTMTNKDRTTKAYEHIQVTFDATNKVDWDSGFNKDTLLNCYMGLTIQKLPMTDFHMPNVQFIPNYSYNIRVLYLTIARNRTVGDDSKASDINDQKMKAKLQSWENNNVQIRVENDPDQDGHNILFETDATYIFPKCDVLPISETREYQPCLTYKTDFAYEGKFAIDDVTTINIDAESSGQQRVQGSIRVTAERWRVWLVAVEMIVRQKIPNA